MFKIPLKPKEPEKTVEKIAVNQREAARMLGIHLNTLVAWTKQGIVPHRRIGKPFNNMRASRSTEIYNEYGAFLESQWIGHSTKVAQAHYLQVRDEDFEKAVGNINRNENTVSRHNSRHHETTTSKIESQTRKTRKT